MLTSGMCMYIYVHLKLHMCHASNGSRSTENSSQSLTRKSKRAIYNHRTCTCSNISNESLASRCKGSSKKCMHGFASKSQKGVFKN